MLNIADPDWKPHIIKEKEFVMNVKKSKQVMFLTGAGMSVASGISTFRGVNGLWDKENMSKEMSEKV